MTAIRISPGPWKASWFYGKDQISDADGKNVADVRGRKNGINGPAIAAVPEMLDVLAKVSSGDYRQDELAEMADQVLSKIKAQMPQEPE